MSAPQTVYKMLSFQYKPVERHMFARITPDQVKLYKRLPATRKISILDKWADKFMGLA